jgi:hypothetical protein
MYKYYKTLILMIVFTFLIPQNVSAKEITINELIEGSKELDGHEVSIQGEVIGECMVRGDYAWININDGSNAIGVWIKKSEAMKIKNYGNYDSIGDTVRIKGIFDRDCVEHGGEADIHNQTMIIVKNGYIVKEEFSEKKVIATIVLVCSASLLGILYMRLGRKTKLKNNER